MPTLTKTAGMPIPRRELANRRLLHAVNEFCSGVQLMSELEEHKTQEAHVGDLVKELVLALQNQARTRPHPLLYVNLGFVLTLAFWSGVQWQRVNTIELTTQRLQAVEMIPNRVDSINGQLAEVRSEMKAIRDRLDRFMDKGR